MSQKRSSVELVQGVKCRIFAQEKVQLPSGLSLVMSLDEPSLSPNTENKLAVLLHPWSWLGGSMSDPVLRLLSQTLKRKGFYTLRYNSRGVGGSSGRRSLSGLQEGMDLREVVEWALSYVPDVRHVLIVGYSHGALIAAQHPVLPDIVHTSHIILSYPLDKLALLTFFHSKTHIKALDCLVKTGRSNVLILYGDQDEFTSAESYRSWVDELRKCHSGSGRLVSQEVHEGSHFWRDYDAVELRKTVEAWVENSSPRENNS